MMPPLLRRLDVSLGNPPLTYRFHYSGSDPKATALYFYRFQNFLTARQRMHNATNEKILPQGFFCFALSSVKSSEKI
jgi:hypothetical protein